MPHGLLVIDTRSVSSAVELWLDCSWRYLRLHARYVRRVSLEKYDPAGEGAGCSEYTKRIIVPLVLCNYSMFFKGADVPVFLFQY